MCSVGFLVDSWGLAHGRPKIQSFAFLAEDGRPVVGVGRPSVYPLRASREGCSGVPRRFNASSRGLQKRWRRRCVQARGLSALVCPTSRKTGCWTGHRRQLLIGLPGRATTSVLVKQALKVAAVLACLRKVGIACVSEQTKGSPAVHCVMRGSQGVGRFLVLEFRNVFPMLEIARDPEEGPNGQHDMCCACVSQGAYKHRRQKYEQKYQLAYKRICDRPTCFVPARVACCKHGS